MKLEDIKTKMYNFEDALGFSILENIGEAKTKSELKKILIQHKQWLENVCEEAKQSVDNFIIENNLE